MGLHPAFGQDTTHVQAAAKTVIKAHKKHHGNRVGFLGIFGKLRDSDHDGVPDKRDKCPFDSGMVVFNGCPDQDLDSIPDYADSCPTQAGPIKFNGCPDSDGDGIPDRFDACPDVFGLAQFNGCPDSDGDGIPDPADSCPHQAGLAAYNGCPDSDGDGIPDDKDICPFVAGPADNHGCPYRKGSRIDVTEDLDRNQVHFAFNKFTITQDSYPYLDSIVATMKKFPQTKVRVDGYSDIIGPEMANVIISKQRALEVRRYLMHKGIDTKRIIVKANGYSDPVADNKTRSGRALNRRATMVVRNDSAAHFESVFTSYTDEFGRMFIKLTSTTEDHADVAITNTAGAVVKTFVLPANKNYEFTLDQPAGVYTLSAKTGTVSYNARLVIAQ